MGVINDKQLACHISSLQHLLLYYSVTGAQPKKLQKTFQYLYTTIYSHYNLSFYSWKKKLFRLYPNCLTRQDSPVTVLQNTFVQTRTVVPMLTHCGPCFHEGKQAQGSVLWRKEQAPCQICKQLDELMLERLTGMRILEKIGFRFVESCR